MQQCMLWRKECRYPLSLILAGSTLFAGGREEVAAYSAHNGSQSWQARTDGNVYGLAAANGRLYASTDLGAVHCFAPQLSSTLP